MDSFSCSIDQCQGRWWRVVEWIEKGVIWGHFVGLALIHSVRSLFASHCYCQSLQLLWPKCWLCSIQIFWHRFVFLFSTVHFYSLASLCLENELHLILKTQFLIFCWLDARLAWENQFHWAQKNYLQRLWVKLLKVVVLLVRPYWLKACWDCQCGSKSDLTLADVICSNAAKSWLQSLDDSCINHQGLHVAFSSSAAILMMTMAIIMISIKVIMMMVAHPTGLPVRGSRRVHWDCLLLLWTTFSASATWSTWTWWGWWRSRWHQACFTSPSPSP